DPRSQHDAHVACGLNVELHIEDVEFELIGWQTVSEFLSQVLDAEPRRQKSPRGTRKRYGFERKTLAHAAGTADQLAESDSHGDLVNSGPPDVATDREKAPARTLVKSLLLVRLAVLVKDDEGNPGEGFHIVQKRRAAIQPVRLELGRTVSRFGATVL